MARRSFWKKAYIVLAAAALSAVLSGCMFVSSPNDLYKLPRLPEEYVDLETEIKALLSSGYEYAAPTGGENIQLVQMVDLDGDETEEALVFMRKSGDPKPLNIHIFKRSGDEYRPVAVIKESGASIGRVDYQDINGDGLQELIVGYRMTTADASNVLPEDTTTDRGLTRIVSVYSLEKYSCEKLLETSYNSYIMTDLDKNGLPEIVVISGSTMGNCSAVAYEWSLGRMVQAASAKLSVPPVMLEEVRVGTLTDGAQGLFVTGRIDEKMLVMDLLVMRNGRMVNCGLNNQSGISDWIYYDAGLPSSDINEDGYLEIPVPYELKKAQPEDASYRGIHWLAFDSSGKSAIMETTYHNATDGWYLVLPESWKDNLMVTKVGSVAGERSITFGIYRAGSEPLEILTIYTETGDNREYKATQGKRFVLLRQTATIYAAEFLAGYEEWSGAMSQDALRDAFHLIRTEWYAET